MDDTAQPPRSRTHRRDVDGQMHIWEVDRLIALAATLPVERRPVADFDRDLDEVWWFGGPDHQPTVRAVIDHARRIASVDLAFPIILSAEGIVVDGMHRVAKAHMDAKAEIAVVQFAVDPPPDRVEPLP